MPTPDIDRYDAAILMMLQRNARLPAAEIARAVGLGASTVHQRIRRLEDTGIIRGYEARLDARALGAGLVAFVRVQTGPSAVAPRLTEAISALPEVQEVHRVVGEDCFFVKVRVSDTEALAALLDERLQRIPDVASTKTTIVLTTAKEVSAIALGVPDDSPEISE